MSKVIVSPEPEDVPMPFKLVALATAAKKFKPYNPPMGQDKNMNHHNDNNDEDAAPEFLAELLADLGIVRV